MLQSSSFNCLLFFVDSAPATPSSTPAREPYSQPPPAPSPCADTRATPSSTPKYPPARSRESSAPPRSSGQNLPSRSMLAPDHAARPQISDRAQSHAHTPRSPSPASPRRKNQSRRNNDL